MAQNRHHIWWPKKNYRSDIEKRFRNLSCNIVWIDEVSHRLLHHYTEPPRKPTLHEMHQAVQSHNKGLCSCNR